MSEDVLKSPMQNPLGKTPGTVNLDLTPQPYIALQLQCPICGNMLYPEYISGLGTKHTHHESLISSGAKCANSGKVYMVDSKLQVKQV